MRAGRGFFTVLAQHLSCIPGIVASTWSNSNTVSSTAVRRSMGMSTSTRTVYGLRRSVGDPSFFSFFLYPVCSVLNGVFLQGYRGAWQFQRPSVAPPSVCLALHATRSVYVALFHDTAVWAVKNQGYYCCCELSALIAELWRLPRRSKQHHLYVLAPLGRVLNSKLQLCK